MEDPSSLEALTPGAKRRVYDLVQEAGLDVSEWSDYANGDTNPAANPSFCYEWAFKGHDVAVLNLWVEDMELEAGEITYRVNQRELVESGQATGPRAARAVRMDRILQEAFDRELQVRVINCYSGDETDNVKLRDLDTELWRVAEYDHSTGDAVVRRGDTPTSYHDQFSLPTPPDGEQVPEKRTGLSNQYERRPDVRQYALRRARGRCEFCGSRGFQTEDGRLFLETHHIIPLAERGPDTPQNVISLCPNHHREAHYGANRDSLREDFQRILLHKQSQ